MKGIIRQTCQCTNTSPTPSPLPHPTASPHRTPARSGDVENQTRNVGGCAEWEARTPIAGAPVSLTPPPPPVRGQWARSLASPLINVFSCFSRLASALPQTPPWRGMMTQLVSMLMMFTIIIPKWTLTMLAGFNPSTHKKNSYFSQLAKSSDIKTKALI